MTLMEFLNNYLNNMNSEEKEVELFIVIIVSLSNLAGKALTSLIDKQEPSSPQLAGAQALELIKEYSKLHPNSDLGQALDGITKAAMEIVLKAEGIPITYTTNIIQ